MIVAKPPFFTDEQHAEWELLPPYTIIEAGDRAWAWDWLWGPGERPPLDMDRWHQYEAGAGVIGKPGSPQDIHARRRKKT